MGLTKKGSAPFFVHQIFAASAACLFEDSGPPSLGSGICPFGPEKGSSWVNPVRPCVGMPRHAPEGEEPSSPPAPQDYRGLLFGYFPGIDATILR